MGKLPLVAAKTKRQVTDSLQPDTAHVANGRSGRVAVRRYLDQLVA